MNILGIIGSIFGLATTVTTFTVAVLWAMPFAWLMAFNVPAHLINILFFCFQFYLTGGLLNYIFSSSIGKTNNLAIVFNIKDSPIFIYFLVIFGFALFFLIFQICFFFWNRAVYFSRIWHLAVKNKLSCFIN